MGCNWMLKKARQQLPNDNFFSFRALNLMNQLKLTGTFAPIGHVRVRTQSIFVVVEGEIPTPAEKTKKT